MRTKKEQLSEAAKDEAMRIARGTQQPGQTKAQTRLIAKGIQKGIGQYKKQQSSRARELDKQRKKVERMLTSPEAQEIQVHEKIVHRQHWLPWVLLVLTWLAIAVYWFIH